MQFRHSEVILEKAIEIVTKYSSNIDESSKLHKFVIIYM